MKITKVQTAWPIEEPATGRPTQTLIIGGATRAEVVRDGDGSSLGVSIYAAANPLRRRLVAWSACTIEYEMPEEQKKGDDRKK